DETNITARTPAPNRTALARLINEQETRPTSRLGMRELTDERSSSQADAGCINQEVENNAERQHFGQASSPDRNRRRQRLAGFRRRGGNRSERAGGGRDTLRQPRLERHRVGAGYRLRADRSQPVGGGARCLVVVLGGEDRTHTLGSQLG